MKNIYKNIIRSATDFLILEKICIFLFSFFLLFLLHRIALYQAESRYNLSNDFEPRVAPIWEKKIQSSQKLKIGIINDNHIRPTRINRDDDSEKARRVIKEDDLNILNNFNKQSLIAKSSFIVQLGDSIEGTDDPDYVGISGIELIKYELEKSGVPVYWVLGNHELRSITKDQFREILSLDSLDYVRDWGDYRFIFLDGNYNPKNKDNDFEGYGFIPGYIHPKTLVWLEEQLKTDKRVLVFMHQAILSQEYLNQNQLAKNPVFNNLKIKRLFEKYKVEAFFNGHIESRYYQEVEGVKYYSLPGAKKSLEFPEAFYFLTIENSEIKLDMFYQDTISKKQIKLNFETGEVI